MRGDGYASCESTGHWARRTRDCPVGRALRRDGIHRARAEDPGGQLARRVVRGHTCSWRRSTSRWATREVALGARARACDAAVSQVVRLAQACVLCAGGHEVSRRGAHDGEVMTGEKILKKIEIAAKCMETSCAYQKLNHWSKNTNSSRADSAAHHLFTMCRIARLLVE